MKNCDYAINPRYFRKTAEPPADMGDAFGLWLDDLYACLRDHPKGGPAREAYMSYSTLNTVLADSTYSLKPNFVVASPARHAEVQRVLRGIRAEHGAEPVRKRPLMIDSLDTYLAASPETVRAIRDAAILCVGVYGCRRRSEIVGLDFGPGGSGSGYATITNEGLLIKLRRSKTSRAGDEELPYAICLAPCIRATDLDFLYYCFWHWRAHVQRLMRAGVVVLFEPMVDDDLGLLGRREPLRIEDLTT